MVHNFIVYTLPGQVDSGHASKWTPVWTGFLQPCADPTGFVQSSADSSPAVRRGVPYKRQRRANWSSLAISHARRFVLIFCISPSSSCAGLFASYDEPLPPSPSPSLLPPPQVLVVVACSASRVLHRVDWERDSGWVVERGSEVGGLGVGWVALATLAREAGCLGPSQVSQYTSQLVSNSSPSAQCC